MFSTLQEIREHIRDEPKDLTVGETKNYLVEPLLEYLEWPIRTSRKNLDILFTEDTSETESFDYLIFNDDFSVSVKVIPRSEFELSIEEQQKTKNSDKIQKPYMHVVTDGRNYQLIWVGNDENCTISKFNVLIEEDTWALNFLNANSISRGSSKREGQKIARLKLDRQRLCDQNYPSSFDKYNFNTINSDDLEQEFINNLIAQIDEEAEKIKSKFVDLLHGVEKGHDFNDIVNGFKDNVLLAEKGGAGLEDYIGAGDAWGSVKINNQEEPDYLALIQPDSDIFRYIMEVEEIMEKNQFEREKNVDLDSYDWYDQGESLVRVSQIYHLKKSYSTSEAVEMTDIPVLISTTEVVEEELKTT